jgi:hypothetical protein
LVFQGDTAWRWFSPFFPSVDRSLIPSLVSPPEVAATSSVWTLVGSYGNLGGLQTKLGNTGGNAFSMMVFLNFFSASRTSEPDAGSDKRLTPYTERILPIGVSLFAVV